MANLRSLLGDIRLLRLVYAIALILGVLLLPLWLPEILQVAGSMNPQVMKLGQIIRLEPDASRISQLLNWSAAMPGDAPLGYLVQLPFVSIFGAQAWAARLPSVAFALLNVFLFWKLAERVNLRNQLIAVVLFAAMPIHYRFSVEGRPFEMALTFVLTSALMFLQVLETPTVSNAILYGLSLVACLFTVPRSVIVGVGFALCTLAFIQRKEVRAALWQLLPAIAGAILVYLPYFAWTQRQKLPYRLIPGDTYWLGDTTWPMAVRDFTGGADVCYVLTFLLVIGAGLGTWRALSYSAASQSKRQALLCIIGGSFLNIVVNVVFDDLSNLPFHPSQFLWSLPGFTILFTAGLDWIESKVRFVLWPVAGLILAICLAGNYTFLTSRQEDIKALAKAALPEVTPKSCVVFVSERLSPVLFRTLEPALSPLECDSFFFHRIILLVHPYVEPDQQADAEFYFRGLNFKEVKREKIGGGQLIVVESGS